MVKLQMLTMHLRLQENATNNSKKTITPKIIVLPFATAKFEFHPSICRTYTNNSNDMTAKIIGIGISNIPALLKYANNVESVEYNIPTLNDVFLHLTGKHIAKEEHSEGGFMERYAQYEK